MAEQLVSAGFFIKEYDDLSKKYIYYIVDKSIVKEGGTLILTGYQFGIFTSILYTIILKKKKKFFFLNLKSLKIT
jgi:hypothetical protein